jgi:DNA-binding response OmpR family regulator
VEQTRVLIVDDEEELIAALVERFELRGIEAVGVTRGKEAVRLIQDNGFDVVVLDVKMPGIDGFEIMRQMKIIKEDLPIILITGHDCRDGEEKLLMQMAFDCLIKPVNIDILMDKVRKATQRKSDD